MTTETLLQKLNKAALLRQLETNSKDSVKWFMRNARYVAGRDKVQTLLIKQQQKATGIGKVLPIGQMYCYAYDPKHADTLPYFDRFPLIFYVGPAKGGFYGINLHYLPPKARAILFDALIKITNNPVDTAMKKVKLTYDLLNASKKYKLFKPCFKHYLASQLQTRVVKIPYEEWGAALYLPTAQFEKANPNKVWSDSMLGVK